MAWRGGIVKGWWSVVQSKQELHGESMMIYTGDSVLLLAAGLILPGAIRKR